MLHTYTINMEAPAGTPLANAIDDVQAWLDLRRMKPIRLASEKTGQILFLEIEFRARNEASFFERDFGSPSIVGLRPSRPPIWHTPAARANRARAFRLHTGQPSRRDRVRHGGCIPGTKRSSARGR